MAKFKEPACYREYLMAKVRVDEAGCWIWTGYINKGTGRGECSYHGKSVQAHRLSYTLFVGGIPAGMVLRHTCDVGRCVNPEHLVPGTQKQNMADMIERNRAPVGDQHYSRTNPERLARGDRNGARLHPDRLPRGEKHANAKLTADDARNIREARADGVKLSVLADRYGVSETQISNIARGKQWGHV